MKNILLVLFSLPLLAVPSADAQLNLVNNGDFTTGDFTGWNLSGADTNGIFVDDGSISGITPESGNFLAALGSVGSVSYLSQTLATVPDVPYLLSLWLNSPGAETPNEFVVSWGGQILLDASNLPEINVWTNLQFTVLATETKTVLEFGGRDDNSYLGLDNISVMPAPVFGPDSAIINNTYTPSPVGAKLTYRGYGGDYSGTTEVDEAVGVELINGVECLKQITTGKRGQTVLASGTNLLAEDTNGNVWVLESLDSPEPNTYGTALIFPNNPFVGEGVANLTGDSFTYISLGQTVSIGLGTFKDCAVLEDDNGILAYFAPGVGRIRTLFPDGSHEDLAAFSGIHPVSPPNSPLKNENNCIFD